MVKEEEVTFEVLILTGSRWEAQGVYGAQEQGLAVTDAKSLERVSTIRAVKVVKEYYDKRTRGSRSVNVYESRPKGAAEQPAQASRAQASRAQASGAAKKLRTPTQKSRSSKPRSAQASSSQKSSGGSMSDTMVAAPPPLAEASPRPPLFGAFLKTLISLALAIVAAIVVTQLVSMSMGQRQVIGFMNRDDFLIAVFILVFAIMSLALIARILSNLKPMAPRPPRDVKAERPTPSHRNMTMQRNADLDAARLAELEARNAALAEADAEVRAREEEDARRQDMEALQHAQRERDAQRSEAITMKAFTTDALGVVQGDPENRDSHMVFGLVLFLVGAVQVLRQHQNIDEDTFRKIATQSLDELGLSQERAERFIEKTDEYLISNARYSQMFQSGRAAMTMYLEDNVEPHNMLVKVLSEWDMPTPKVESSQPVTVLFTDIVGSTAMTQKLGDAVAQEIVRVHNTIVREAIHVFTGKEIKHTGDGIMASFASAASGVEAACDIQRKVKVHSATHPERPLALKIGLNAGEPISEDDDLFGSTVQLAARIVDKAEAGCILVSSSVQGLCQGKNLGFEKFGDLEMKGFDEPVLVYAAVWEEQPEQKSQPPQVQPDSPPQSKSSPTRTPAQTDPKGKDHTQTD